MTLKRIAGFFGISEKRFISLVLSAIVGVAAFIGGKMDLPSMEFASAVDANISVSDYGCSQKIDKKVIQICYNYEAKGPNWVAYMVDGGLVDKQIEKRPRFYAEKNIPLKYRSKPADYTYATDSKTGKFFFNRGHLAPDADFDYSQKTLNKVYTMANIIPQEETNNQKNWIKAESRERELAKKYGKVYVISGALYKDKDLYLVKRAIDEIAAAKKWKKNKKIRYEKQAAALAKKHILIPTHLYKIITTKDRSVQECYLYENRAYNPKADRLSNHKVDCASLSAPDPVEELAK